jgi:hypothetical protein
VLGDNAPPLARQAAERKALRVSPEGASKVEARLADDLQILGRTLAVTALDEFVLHALTLAQAVVASPLDRRDVHERVGTATIRLNEPVALGGVEPLYSSGLQRTCPHVRRETTPGNHAATQGPTSPPRFGLKEPYGDVERRPRRNIVRHGAHHKRAWLSCRRLFALGRRARPREPTRHLA